VARPEPLTPLEPADSRLGFLVCVVFVIERDGQVLLLKRSRTKDHAATIIRGPTTV